MKLEDAREAYYQASDTASDLNRKAAFAGIAVIWIFRIEEDVQQLGLTTLLTLSGVLLVVGLGLDLLQYFVKAALWGGFARRMELKGSDEFEAPRWINWPVLFLFWAKLIATTGGYALLAKDLIARA